MNLKVSVFFKDLKSLQTGNPVLLDGNKAIGKVTKVELMPDRENGKNWKVDINIQKGYFSHSRNDSLFYIDENKSAEADGSYAIHMDQCMLYPVPALSWGDSVEGVDSWLIWKFRRCATFSDIIWQRNFLRRAKPALNNVSESIDDVRNHLDDFLQSPKGQKTKINMDELYDAVGEISEAKGKKLYKELPVLIEDIKSLAEELRKSGHEEEAKKLEKPFARLIKEPDEFIQPRKSRRIEMDMNELYDEVEEFDKANIRILSGEFPTLIEDIKSLAEELRKTGREEEAKKLEKKIEGL
jgi:tetratricopeptide (TPR) repeat protein